MNIRHQTSRTSPIPQERRSARVAPRSGEPGARNILTALAAAADIQGVQGHPGWRVHRMTEDREGTWSVSVSGNWRITFDLEGGDVTNLDLEDYH
jgi:plasmid maintenance system killer protein